MSVPRRVTLDGYKLVPEPEADHTQRAAEFAATIARAAEENREKIMKSRNAYLDAFIAETGLRPSECEIVEEVTAVDGGIRTVMYARARTVKA